MAKKKAVAPKTAPADRLRKGLAGAAESGGDPVRVAIDRFAIQLPLRDMFAAVALNSILTVTTKEGNQVLADGTQPLLCLPQDFASEIAYRYADAMLAERGRK